VGPYNLLIPPLFIFPDQVIPNLEVNTSVTSLRTLLMSFAIQEIPPLNMKNSKHFTPSHSHSGSRSSVQSSRGPASLVDPITSALSTAQARYTLSNSKSLKAHNEACHDFPGGNTRTVLHCSPFPMTFGPNLLRESVYCRQSWLT
jgi:hypothetical protein